MDAQEAAIQMARTMNLKMHARKLDIKVPNQMAISYPDDTQTIFIGQAGPIVEQLVADGPINNQTIEQRIEIVISTTNNFLQMQNISSNFKFYEDYKTNLFDFKVYVQDMDIGPRLSRSFNAYFIEPTFKDFYQFSVSVILDKPVTKLKIDRIDVENDPITKIIYEYCVYFMNTLKLNK